MKKRICILLCAILAFGPFCFAVPAYAEGRSGGDGIRNVIFMIGDGMGIDHLRLAEQEGYELFMEQNADLTGWSRTRSYSHTVTDSAAGATALSCGVRVNNRQVCVYPDAMNKSGVQPRMITENAALRGMRVGVVTTDMTSGATPAAYSSHTSSRDNGADISAQQLASGFDLIWGAKTGDVTSSAAAANGYTYFTNVTGLRVLKAGERSFGQLPSDCWSLTPSKSSPTLSEMTEKSISLLSTDAPEGFFLMVEGAHIDKFADDTNEDGAVDYAAKRADTAEAVAGFDRAVQAAVEYARADGHTLVIVTADHETGDLYFDEAAGEYTFHSASHTAKNVPVFVYGASDLFAEGGEMDNCDIPDLIAGKLGWGECFPIDDAVPQKPTEEPGDGGSSGSDGGDSRNFFQRVIDWFRGIFAAIAAWFRR